MPVVVMLITLLGSYGYTGGAPVIQGFQTVAACRAAIPQIRKFYGTVDRVTCVSLPAG